MSRHISPRPTIIEVVQHLRPGGIESLALEMQHLLASEARVVIVSLEGDLADAVTSWPALKGRESCLEFLGKTPGWRLDTLYRLVSVLRRLQPVAVHSHHIGPLLYAGLAARLAGVERLVHTEHDAWHLESPRRRLLQRGALALLRPQLVADSELVAERMRALLSDRPLRVIRNGVDTTRFRPGDRSKARQRLGLPENCRLIGCAARLHPVKNHAALLRTLAVLPRDVHLALAGSGELEAKLRAQAARLNVVQRVHFLGLVGDMPSFYQALDLFCLASTAEGMPLSPLEAQACACPVVATDVGGTAETVCPDSGSLVHADSDHALAEALRRTLDAPQRVDCRNFVTRNGSALAMIGAYRQLLLPEPA